MGDNDDDEDDVVALEKKMQTVGMPPNVWKHAQRELRYINSALMTAFFLEMQFPFRFWSSTVKRDGTFTLNGFRFFQTVEKDAATTTRIWQFSDVLGTTS